MNQNRAQDLLRLTVNLAEPGGGVEVRTSARCPREGEGSRAAGSPVLHLHVRGSMTLLLEGWGVVQWQYGSWQSIQGLWPGFALYLLSNVDWCFLSGP